MNKEQTYLHYITKLTKTQNVDNISRTKAYQRFYTDFPEIKWSLLASLVSRNAGWNMTDLYLPSFQNLLGEKERMDLFMTYERANWLIFSDAFPQLLVYQLSKKKNKALFDLLAKFNVSTFMIREWYHFWKTYNKDRLMTALIINEQNVIQNPVIEQSYFKKYIFHHLPYIMQNVLLMSAVILPTKSMGLFGVTIYHFTSLSKRIEIGKRTANILFSKKVYKWVLHFVETVEHTGSRYDYEKFIPVKLPKSPVLRLVYPIISHKDIIREDWFHYRGINKKWYRSYKESKINCIEKSFYFKRFMMNSYSNLKSILKQE